jgi:2-oxoglutarate ferredoxin oxidoreductase subunit gamma
MQSALIAGSGGQGILFLGKLLAQSAMLSGKNVTWFPSYGAEIRGGTANCTVVISDGVIGSPIINSPDVLLVLNEESKARFEGRIRPKGALIFDSSAVKSPPSRADIEVLGVPASEIADSLGSRKAANMVMLGALLSRVGSVSLDVVLRALDEAMSGKSKSALDTNKKAVVEGKRYCEH